MSECLVSVNTQRVSLDMTKYSFEQKVREFATFLSRVKGRFVYSYVECFEPYNCLYRFDAFVDFVLALWDVSLRRSFHCPCVLFSIRSWMKRVVLPMKCWLQLLHVIWWTVFLSKNNLVLDTGKLFFVHIRSVYCSKRWCNL